PLTHLSLLSPAYPAPPLPSPTLSLSLHCSGDHPDLPSFPTRRSSDLVRRMLETHPDVPVFAAALDRELNDRGYILPGLGDAGDRDRKSTRLNSSHDQISYAVFCLKKKKRRTKRKQRENEVAKRTCINT